jgi:hypothetical protein
VSFQPAAGRSNARPAQELAARLPGSAAVCALDIAAGDIEPLLCVIERCPSPLRRLVIIDAVLDKTSTRAMRRSLRGTIRAVEALVTWGRQQDHEVLIVSANSVAAHARWPNSTTYGRLKSHQAEAYRASAAPAAIVYLPFLYNGQSPAASTLDQLLWPFFDFRVRACSYDDAAELLCAVATWDPPPDGSGAVDVEVATRDHRLLELRGLAPGRPTRVIGRLAALPIALLGKSLLRSSPAWQRRSAYACRLLTPERLRDARDHHRLLHDDTAPMVDLRAVQLADPHVPEGGDDERRRAAVRLPRQ